LQKRRAARPVCTQDTARVLPDNIAKLAYDAWEAARLDILDRWLEGADPRRMQPAIPKPMRDAADLLRSHAPKDLPYDRLRTLLDAVEAPYDTRTQGMMRQTLNEHEDVRDRVVAVIRLVDELGLQPPPPVEPLPEIGEQDINLVTWMALVPSKE